MMIELDKEVIIGLDSILNIFMDNIGELENLTREQLTAEYGYAKYLKDNICKHCRNEEG